MLSGDWLVFYYKSYGLNEDSKEMNEDLENYIRDTSKDKECSSTRYSEWMTYQNTLFAVNLGLFIFFIFAILALIIILILWISKWE